MPSSHLLQLNEIMQLIFLTKPQSLLDIGVGFGKYGVLAQEYSNCGTDGGSTGSGHGGLTALKYSPIT